MKKPTLTTILFSLICTLIPLPAAAQEAPAVHTEQSDKQQQALAEFLRLQHECRQTLRGVCNKETADAAATLFHRHMQRLDELAAIFRQMNPDTVQQAMADAEMRYPNTRKEMARLLLADFYHSAALSEAIMESPVHALPAQNLPADLQQKLEQTAQDTAFFREKMGQNISGGYGFTPQTAWVLRAAPDIRLQETCTVLAGYLFPNTGILESAGLEASAVYSEKLFTDGKALIRLCVDIIPTGDSPNARYRFNQWFDVSALVPFRSEADVERAVIQLGTTLQQMSKRAEGIHDKASADAAAEQLSALAKLGREQADGLRWLSEDEFSDLLRKYGHNPVDIFIAPFLKLQEEDYYGSEKLRHALRIDDRE